MYLHIETSSPLPHVTSPHTKGKGGIHLGQGVSTAQLCVLPSHASRGLGAPSQERDGDVAVSFGEEAEDEAAVDEPEAEPDEGD